MAKETVKKDNKNKKQFFKDFKAELKRVNWPTPKQLSKNTMAVIVIVIITVAIVFVLDIAFDALNNYGINRLKSAIKNTVSVQENINETVDTNEAIDSESNELDIQLTE